MSGSPRSVRRLALLAVGLSALLVTAGCSGAIGGLGADGDGGGPRLDSVPASAEYVAYVDAAGMASDESLRSIANAALAARSEHDGDAPADVEALFERARNDSGLDPTKVEDVTAFGTTPENPMEDEGSSAMVLSASYSEDELVAAMEEQGGELAEETYGDATLYVSASGEDDESVLAVLGDGAFAVGDRSAVESVVDVRAGDADALGGDLEAAFEDTGDGYVRFASAAPSGGATEEAASDAPMDAAALQNVEYVAGSFATGGGNVTTTVNLVAASESDAERTYEFVDGALSLYASMGEKGGEARAALDAVSVEQDGDTVTVTHTDTVENVEAHVETLYGFGAASASVSGSASASNSTSAAVATVSAGE